MDKTASGKTGFVVGRIAPARLTPTDGMTMEQLSELRAAATNNAMGHAFGGNLPMAEVYARIAQDCDRRTRNPNGLSPEAWAERLASYARMAA